MSGRPTRVVPVPSIRSRLGHALVAWALLWGIAVAAAVWLAAAGEVDELLDDALQSSAELLGALVDARPGAVAGPQAAPIAVAPPPGGRSERFAWQVVDHDGHVLMHSSLAPDQPWHAQPVAGFGDAGAWRLYGMPLAADGRMLYAAQTQAERSEARFEVVLGAVLAALAIGLLGQGWLRGRVRAELVPLQTLSDRLAALDPGDTTLALGPAQRLELEPVHGAIDALTQRLARRIASERAFAGHAAHSLRTPLAGIDAQLAVALRECDPALRPRLKRVREAAARLQRVVAALLGLFRSGAEPQRRSVDLAAHLALLPLDGLALQVTPDTRVQADPDLLAAALLNLLDNSQRHGARAVRIGVPRPDVIRLEDDGPGVEPARRAALQAALDAQAYEGVTGLGLMLADRVARAHGGALRLPEVASGFAVELQLAAG